MSTPLRVEYFKMTLTMDVCPISHAIYKGDFNKNVDLETSAPASTVNEFKKIIKEKNKIRKKWIKIYKRYIKKKQD